MDPFESIKQTFFQECDELLTDAEQGLLAMEAGDADSETINAVFRAVHSVKGGAGAFGLEDLIRFAHVFETVMDELRSGKMELTDEVAKTLLRAFDVLADHVAAARDGSMVDEARSAGILSELKSLIGEDGLADDGALGDDEDFGFVPMAVSIDDDAGAAAPPLDFDLMGSDYRPGDRSRREDDRYLLLEALLSAREQLYISWVGRSIRDNSERPASVLIGQLRDHLASGWRLADDSDADHQTGASYRNRTIAQIQPVT